MGGNNTFYEMIKLREDKVGKHKNSGNRLSIPWKKMQQIDVNLTQASLRNRSDLIKFALSLKYYTHAFSLLSLAQFAARSCGDAKQVCNFK